MNPTARIGAVGYLNSKPLVEALPHLVPQAQIVLDVPSRLADLLAAGQLDVGLIPSVEYFAHPQFRIVSDACIGCAGAVWSVKLLSRVPVEQIRSLALDEGSRTSAALVQILLAKQHGVRPRVEPLPLDHDPLQTTTDAVLVIGDRAMGTQPDERFPVVWDLGQKWYEWTGLPFVFAMWVARPEADHPWLAEVLNQARDWGLAHLEQIAQREAPQLGLSVQQCLRYFQHNLHFVLGPRERQALEHFYRLARQCQLVQQEVCLGYQDCRPSA